MAAPGKSTFTNLLALQAVATAAAAAGKVASSVIDVSTFFAAQLMIRIGRTAITAFTASTGVDAFVQARFSDTEGDLDLWAELLQLSTGALIACNTNTLTNAAGNALGNGDTTALTLSANAAANYSLAKDLLYFKNAAAVANGEFHHCRFAGTASTALYIMDNLVRNQNSGTDAIYNGAVEWCPVLDLSGVKALRLVIINNSGLTVDVQAYLETLNTVA